MTSSKPDVGAAVPRMQLPLAGTDRMITIGGTQDRWTMLFVYRGRHCPRCKRFLNKLNAALADWTRVMDVDRKSVV